jgi:hypothetical protein
MNAKSGRLKRGGGNTFVALDGLEAEERYRIEPADVVSADKLYERRWALTLLETVLQRLEAEELTPEARERFAALRPVLVGEPAMKDTPLSRDVSVWRKTPLSHGSIDCEVDTASFCAKPWPKPWPILRKSRMNCGFSPVCYRGNITE